MSVSGDGAGDEFGIPISTYDVTAKFNGSI
jgi:hypothetical protein